MRDKVIKTIKENNLINIGDSILVAVSGGPDSICLLHILHSLSEEYNLKIYVAHLNHQIRGVDAHLDALYVMQTCSKWNIPYFIKSINVIEYCEKNRLGIEDGARKLRYEMFSEISEKIGIDKIAIGHNKNDQAETILMRMMRGTGLHGLRGIDYIREDGVIRPILDLSREEIEEYCEKYSLNPRIDKSNLEDIYSRNKIRLKILPYMKSEFNENIVDCIVRMSNSLKLDGDFIDGEVEKHYKYAVQSYTDCVYIFIDGVQELHYSVQSRLVFKSINDLIGSVESFDKKHIDDVIDLLDSNKIGKKINLPKGIWAYRFSDYIQLTTSEIVVESKSYSYDISLDELIYGERRYIEEIDKTLKMEIVDVSEFDRNNIKKGIQYIDISKIKGSLKIRERQQGDKIKLAGGTKKIKELFIGMKVPKEDRNSIPLLVDEQNIIAVCGYRISSEYMVDKNTKEVLKFSVE